VRVNELTLPDAMSGERFFDRGQRHRELRLQQAMTAQSDGFGRAPAVGAFRAFVPVEDVFAGPAHRDGIVRVVEQHRQGCGVDQGPGGDSAESRLRTGRHQKGAQV
jgi:hypothetical protein